MARIVDLDPIDVVEMDDEFLVIDASDTSAGPLGTDKRATTAKVGETLVAVASGAINLFDDTTDGLAGTTAGDYFSVPSGVAGEFTILYRHDAGPVATEIKRLPSNAGVDAAIQAAIDAESAVELAEAAQEAAEEFRDQAEDQKGLAVSAKEQTLTYRNEARDARDEAIAIAYGGDYSVTPAAGNVPIAGSTGTLGKGWVAAEYSVQFIGHINWALDQIELLRKDMIPNRQADQLVQMLLQIADLAGQAARTLSGVGEYRSSAGSAARCAVQHRSNPGTGIFFPAADEIGFAINGTEVLRIDSSGIVP